MKEDIAVLDIGSGKISFVVGVKSVDETFVIKNFATSDYSGYFNGEWVSPETLPSDILNVISKSNFDFKTKTLYVATPSEFTYVKTHGMLSNLGKKRTVAPSLIRDIHNKAESFKVNGYSLLCSSALEYVLDSDARTMSPIGKDAQTVYADMSYIFCNEAFIKTLCDIATAIGFKFVKFIDGVWAEGTQLIDEQSRANGCVLIDVGYASTTFAFIKGDGVKYKRNFPFGQGYMIDALANAIGVDYETARDMLSQITLNIESDAMSTYHYEREGKQFECKAREINNFLHYQIVNNLVDFVNYCIVDMQKSEGTNERSAQNNPLGEINLLTEFYLTGGGITEIRGASKYFERALAREVNILGGSTAGWDKPYYASMFATLEVAEKMNRKNSLLEKLFG